MSESNSTQNPICCGSFGLCRQPAKFRCTKCRDATPPTVYCSEKCQKDDWKFHKTYCGKDAYTFDMTLVGSSDPVITRTFDVPSWFTFEQLHYTLQYSMGPWQCSHLHEFAFEKPRASSGRRGAQFFATGERVLDVLPKDLYEDAVGDGDMFAMSGMPPRGAPVPKEQEESLKLSDVFVPEGRLHRVVAPDGDVYPLLYTYDLGDCWEHRLVFKGKKLARADRPLFSAAQGCGPVEDCGGPQGWNRVKAVFRVPPASRTPADKEHVKWAQWVSGLNEAFDPFKEPNVTQMNYEGRWENHLRGFMGLDEDYDHSDGDEPSDYF